MLLSPLLTPSLSTTYPSAHLSTPTYTISSLDFIPMHILSFHSFSLRSLVLNKIWVKVCKSEQRGERRRDTRIWLWHMKWKKCDELFMNAEKVVTAFHHRMWGSEGDLSPPCYTHIYSIYFVCGECGKLALTSGKKNRREKGQGQFKNFIHDRKSAFYSRLWKCVFQVV